MLTSTHEKAQRNGWGLLRAAFRSKRTRVINCTEVDAVTPLDEWEQKVTGSFGEHDRHLRNERQRRIRNIQQQAKINARQYRVMSAKRRLEQ